MADAITLTEAQLFERIGRLQMEASMRAQREDALMEAIAELKKINEGLKKELSVLTVEPEKKKSSG